MRRARRILARDTVITQESAARAIQRSERRKDVVKLVSDMLDAYADDADLEAIEVRVWVKRKSARKAKA